ncbi:MAG: M12 family metallo-peptidase [Planctomycetota bacterium]|jgi:DNA-binding beta-propeller fold protein YncE
MRQWRSMRSVIRSAVVPAGVLPLLLAAGPTPSPRPAGPVGPPATVALPGTGPAALDLRPFDVVTPRTRFVRGTVGGADTALDFDPSSVRLFRGAVRDAPGSRVFVAVTPAGTVGRMTLADGSGWDLSAAADGAAGDLAARPAPPAGGPAPGVAPCRVELDAAAPAPARASAGPVPGGPQTRLIELAVETDHEYFLRHGDLDAAAAYLVALYGAVSDIYLRDVDARVVLSYVRLWDTPADLFNEPDPLVPFRSYWNANMGLVQRDAAQLLSGRRDLPYGGIAYLSALCGSAGYSVVGYVQGSFADPAVPSVFNYDIGVTAHELGHNCAASHTHQYGIDTCDDLDGPARRGTVMSYCGQTRSGGNANRDLRFHTTVQGVMTSYLSGAACLALDCNGNGVDDVADLAGGTSTDADGNGVPDECEDCNANGVLDDADIAAGTSTDANGNGRPDDCEPDCNGNGVPDDLDISGGTSADLHGDGVPDECEADCDDDGTSDYTEILADMSLDVDRDARLDACADCDGDGTPDLAALDGAWTCWVASAADGVVRGFHPLTGVLARTTGLPVVAGGQDLVVDDAGIAYVTSLADDRVVRIDRAGNSLGDFVPAGSGGLDAPQGLLFDGRGDLLVASRDTDSVLRYDGRTGASLGTFASGGGLVAPFGLALGPGGNLFVTGGDGRVIEFDGTTGAAVGPFVTLADNGGLTDPRGLLFKPDGNLLVASRGTNQVLEFDGVTGAFVGQFNNGGTATALTLDGPWGLRLGPDGHVHVSRSLASAAEASVPGHGDGEDRGDPAGLHINSTRIYVFDVDTGEFLRSHVTGHDTGLDLPTGFDFAGGLGVDCNFNLRPDACDIAAGTSLDTDGNGIPDECLSPPCPADVDGDGAVGVGDLLDALAAWGVCPPPCPPDTDGSGAVDVTDVLAILAAWGACPGSS